MDIRQITNIIAIAEEGNISKAANRLFITQSALNRQLINLEKELGVPLFHRTPHGVSLTYAGSIYIENAKQIVSIKNQTYKLLQDISEQQRGEISIWYSESRGPLVLSNVYPGFHEKYPYYTFKTQIGRGGFKANDPSSVLDNEMITFAFLAYAERVSGYEYHHEQVDRIVVGIPLSNPLSIYGASSIDEDLPILDYNLLRNETVLLPRAGSLVRTIVDRQFREANIRPHVLTEVSNIHLLYEMVRKQTAIGFFTAYHVDPNAKMTYMLLPESAEYYFAIITRQNAFLNKAEQYFLELWGEASKKRYYELQE